MLTRDTSIPSPWKLRRPPCPSGLLPPQPPGTEEGTVLAVATGPAHPREKGRMCPESRRTSAPCDGRQWKTTQPNPSRTASGQNLQEWRLGSKNQD